jgi:transcription elongation factor Elf1
MVIMSSRYKKKGCPFCDEDKGNLYPLNATEEQGCFYCKLCMKCHDPIIIYKYHNEPSDAEIQEMTDWAMKTFQGRIPDFERIHVIDHFAIELRPRARAKQITERKVVFGCPICNRFFSSSEMIKSEEGLYVCRDCSIKLPSNSLDKYIGQTNSSIGEPSGLSKELAQYEHIQTMDDEDEEGTNN